jgi:hypothetical protein
MCFSSMHRSNYSIRLHSPYLRTHWELPHSARRHASHAINTLLLHVVLLVISVWGGGAAIFCLTCLTSKKNRSHGFRSGERAHKPLPISYLKHAMNHAQLQAQYKWCQNLCNTSVLVYGLGTNGLDNPDTNFTCMGLKGQHVC